VLTMVRAVNKTDSATMGADFGSLAGMFRASEQALSTVPGLGPTKVKRLHAAFFTSFFRTAGSSQLVAQRRSAPPHDAHADDRAHGGALANGNAVPAQHAAEGVAASDAGAERVGVAGQSLHDDREWLATQEARLGGEDLLDEDDDFV
jgi:NAD-dependent DNA ligase